SHLDEVAILQAALGRQRLAVDQGPVPAPEIADAHQIGVDGEFRMLATHLLAVRPEVAGLTPTDLEFGPDQGDHFPLGLTPHHHQLHFHENRPDPRGPQRQRSASTRTRSQTSGPAIRMGSDDRPTPAARSRPTPWSTRGPQPAQDDSNSEIMRTSRQSRR